MNINKYHNSKFNIYVKLNVTFKLSQSIFSRVPLTNKKTSPIKTLINTSLTIIAFLFFFAAFVFFIRQFITLGNFTLKNSKDLQNYFYYALNSLPILGGLTISVTNHFFRYVKPFNDAILFFSSAITAYFLLEQSFHYKETISQALILIYGASYQYAGSLFLAMCLIGKAFIAFAEFFYEVKKTNIK